MKKHGLIIITSAIIAVMLLFTSCEPNLEMSKVHIVSIGLDYKNSSGVSPLNGTINDAKEVGTALTKLLEHRGLNVSSTFMLQEGTDVNWSDPLYPSDSNVLRVVAEAQPKPNDLFIFYYSGHGDTKDNGETGYIVTAATPENPMYTVVDLDKLYHAFSTYPCNVIVILDSCYSGVICDEDYDTENVSLNDAFGKFFEKRDYGNVISLVSSLNTQTSVVSAVKTEDESYERHGLFTIKLLEAVGWKHSDTKTTPVSMNSIMTDVKGYFSSYAKGLTVRQVYNSIMGKWGTDTQTPVITKRLQNIYLIP